MAPPKTITFQYITFSMKHLEPILAGSKSHHGWDLGGKSLAWMYHVKPVISEISGEKTDNPTDNLPITICWKFGPGKDGGIYRIVNIDERKACSEHAHKHSMTTGLHLCFICILQHPQASSLHPPDQDRQPGGLDPTLWMWPKATDQRDAQTISLPWTSLLLFHAFSITQTRFHPPSYQQSP